jgi:hypothetical protein
MGIGSLQNLYISSFSHVKIFVKKDYSNYSKQLGGRSKSKHFFMRIKGNHGAHEHEIFGVLTLSTPFYMCLKRRKVTIF